MESSESQPVIAGALSGEAAFEQVFKTSFKSLHAYACTILKDDIMAEEMVQNVFCKLWEKKDQIQISQSVNAYLYRSVYNECLNYLKHQKVKDAYVNHARHHMPQQQNNTSGKLQLSELQQRISKALESLPEQCRTVFQLSRFEELKYQEIADRLSISVKTVENHMGKALRLMRTQLADFLPLLLIYLMTL